jgi:drug/metabolite transporter (DMT)-like permease
MYQTLGILFALCALLAWGFGDFFIQKTIRELGSWKALFFIGLAGMIGLFPFILNDIFALTLSNFLLLLLLSVIIILSAVFDFEALRKGKIAVVEPIMGLELPITVGLGIVLAKESLTWIQIILIVLTFIGIMFAITEHHTKLHYHKRIFEKGVILAGVGAIGMALSNFLVGVSSQDTSPILTVWFIHTILIIICIIYLARKNEVKNLMRNFKKYPKTIISQSLFDNVAWVAYGAATTYIPIAIATTISESYIALAVALGLLVNHEKIRKHQILGSIIAIAGVIALSYFSS